MVITIALGRCARVTDQRQCSLGIEPAIIERASRDRAGQFPGARRKQRPDIVDRGKTAGRDDGYRDAFGKLNGGVEIEAFQQTVARDVGEDDRGDAGILEALCDLERGNLRRLGPAFDRDLAVARVEPHRHTTGELLRRTLTSSGSRTAAVPMITRTIPLASHASMVFRSR